MATLDLAGQIAGLPMHRFFGGRLRDKIELTYALSIDAPAAMAESAKSYPFVKCFKLKVSGDEKTDAARVRAVIEARPGDTIVTAPGEEHWHGATPDRFMSHIGELSRTTDTSTDADAANIYRHPVQLDGDSSREKRRVILYSQSVASPRWTAIHLRLRLLLQNYKESMFWRNLGRASVHSHFRNVGYDIHRE